MEFSFTDEQRMIRDTAQAFLAEVSDSQAVRAAMATEPGYDPGLWQRVCGEMFWQGIHIPEAYGGLGLGYVELVATLEQMGRYLLCSPFFSTVCLGTNTLLLAGGDEQKATYLGRILEGATATLAFTGPAGRWDLDGVAGTWREAGEDIRLDGTWRYVPDGHSADFLVVAARSPGSRGADGIGLFLVEGDAAGLSREWLPTMDQTRKQAQVRLDNVRVKPAAWLGSPGDCGESLAQAIDLATVAVAAEQVGGAQQALDATVAYTRERVQFNRTIASYQAVKHKAADMMVKVEAARSAAYYAGCIAQEFFEGGPMGEELAEAASVAKAWCSDAYFFNAGCGIQLHGGVGFTWEYDIQLYFKRARSSETFLGNAAYHRERLAALLLD
jgi:alkylation response protein AidB-like acyl-CoA dehydrogenase